MQTNSLRKKIREVTQAITNNIQAIRDNYSKIIQIIERENKPRRQTPRTRSLTSTIRKQETTVSLSTEDPRTVPKNTRERIARACRRKKGKFQ